MNYHIIISWILLSIILGGCSKNEMNVPEEDWTIMGHVDELTVNGLQNSIQTDITIQYNFQPGVTPVTRTLKTDNQGDFTILIPRAQNEVRILIEKDHFLGIDTLFAITGTVNFNAQLVQLRNFLPLELNKEWQYDVEYIVGDTEGGGATTYSGTESWKITNLDTSTNGFELQITFNGIGVYANEGSRDTTSYVNEINTITFSIRDRRLGMTPCICSQHTTIFDRLNNFLNTISNSGMDIRLMVEHPITFADSLEVVESIPYLDTQVRYNLHREKGMTYLEFRENGADISHIYNYHLITP